MIQRFYYQIFRNYLQHHSEWNNEVFLSHKTAKYHLISSTLPARISLTRVLINILLEFYCHQLTIQTLYCIRELNHNIQVIKLASAKNYLAWMKLNHKLTRRAKRHIMRVVKSYRNRHKISIRSELNLELWLYLVLARTLGYRYLEEFFKTIKDVKFPYYYYHLNC